MEKINCLSRFCINSEIISSINEYLRKNDVAAYLTLLIVRNAGLTSSKVMDLTWGDFIEGSRLWRNGHDIYCAVLEWTDVDIKNTPDDVSFYRAIGAAYYTPGMVQESLYVASMACGLGDFSLSESNYRSLYFLELASEGGDSLLLASELLQDTAYELGECCLDYPYEIRPRSDAAGVDLMVGRIAELLEQIREYQHDESVTDIERVSFVHFLFEAESRLEGIFYAMQNHYDRVD